MILFKKDKRDRIKKKSSPLFFPKELLLLEIRFNFNMKRLTIKKL